MNGYNTNFDGEGNQLYAVNGIPFHYMHEPIEVQARRAGPDLPGQHARVRPDQLASTSTANFFDYFPTGTRLEPTEFTDTIIQGQGQRGICEMRFPHPGRYMFHAHKTEFAELGWMGFFEVGVRMEARSETLEPGGRGLLARCRPGCSPSGAAGADRDRRSLFALARRPRPPDRARAADRGPRGRADRARVPARSSSRCGTRARTRSRSPRSFVNDAYVDFTGASGAIGRLGSAAADARLPLAGGRAATRLRCSPRPGVVIEHSIDGRGRDPERRRRPLRADGAARHLRRGHPGRARDGAAAVRCGASRRRGSRS